MHQTGPSQYPRGQAGINNKLPEGRGGWRGGAEGRGVVSQGRGFSHCGEGDVVHKQAGTNTLAPL